MIPLHISTGLESMLKYSKEITSLPVSVCLCETAAFEDDVTPHILVASVYEHYKTDRVYAEFHDHIPFLIALDTLDVHGSTGNVTDDDITVVKSWVSKNATLLNEVWNMTIDSSEIIERFV